MCKGFLALKEVLQIFGNLGIANNKKLLLRTYACNVDMKACTPGR